MTEILTSDKAHLIYLMPEIIECVTSKEEELKTIVRDLLKELGQMVQIKLPNLKKLKT